MPRTTAQTKSLNEKKTGSISLSVYDMQGKKIEEVSSLFNGKVNNEVMAQAIQMYQTNTRGGLAQTKTRGEVSGGGKKPWKQKGTGRARAGSTRSPLWRHGGVVFGAHPRNMHYQLPAKLRLSALLSALNEKAGQENILLVDTIKINQPKTKELQKILNNLKVPQRVTVVLSQIDTTLARAARNMPRVSLALAKDLNALDVLRNLKVIFLRDALGIIEERLKKIL